jgi:hypothetical protein
VSFGLLRWSRSEKQLLYLAEKLQKKKTYYDPSLEWEDAEKLDKLKIVNILFRDSIFFISSHFRGMSFLSRKVGARNVLT